MDFSRLFHVRNSSRPRRAMLSYPHSLNVAILNQHFNLCTASLWATVRCVVAKSDPSSMYGSLLPGITRSIIIPDGGSSHRISRFHWHRRWGSYDRCSDYRERRCNVERAREVSGYPGPIFCILDLGSWLT